MSKVLNIGVIGCGGILQTMHIRYLRELPEFEIGAICDISEKVLDGVGDQYGVKNRYTDYRDLVKQPDLHAVFVATHDHAEPAIQALDAGKHVMTEKPIAFNLELADQMILAAKDNKRRLMVAYNRRYDPGFEWALPLIRSIDNPKLIRVHNFGGSFSPIGEMYDIYNRSDVPREMIEAAKTKSRNEAIDAIGQEREALATIYLSLVLLCSHDANILHEAFGRPSQILHAEIYDNWFVLALLEYTNGARCVWETGLLNRRPEWDQQLVVYSNSCRIDISFKFPWIKNMPTEVNIRQMEGEVYTNKYITVSLDEAFKREWRHFYECVVNDMQPITSGEKARTDVEFLISLIKAAQ